MKTKINGFEVDCTIDEFLELQNKIDSKPKKIIKQIENVQPQEEPKVEYKVRKGRGKYVDWNKRAEKIAKFIRANNEPVSFSKAYRITIGREVIGSTEYKIFSTIENSHGIRKLSNNKLCSVKIYNKLNAQTDFKPKVKKVEKYSTFKHTDNPWLIFKSKRMKELSNSGLSMIELVKKIALEWQRLKHNKQSINTSSEQNTDDLRDELISDIAKQTYLHKEVISSAFAHLINNKKLSGFDIGITSDKRWESLVWLIIKKAVLIERAWNISQKIINHDGILYLR